MAHTAELLSMLDQGVGAGRPLACCSRCSGDCASAVVRGITASLHHNSSQQRLLRSCRALLPSGPPAGPTSKVSGNQQQLLLQFQGGTSSSHSCSSTCFSVTTSTCLSVTTCFSMTFTEHYSNAWHAISQVIFSQSARTRLTLKSHLWGISLPTTNHIASQASPKQPTSRSRLAAPKVAATLGSTNMAAADPRYMPGAAASSQQQYHSIGGLTVHCPPSRGLLILTRS